jgi:hypothetical protein
MGAGQEQSGADAPTFWVVVDAHYARVFAIFGPLRDDAEWTTRVAIARGQGRDDLTICTVASELDARKIADQLTPSGFTDNAVAIQTIVEQADLSRDLGPS